VVVIGGHHRWQSAVVISGEQRQAQKQTEGINVLGLDEDRLLAPDGALAAGSAEGVALPMRG
jgi:hypothetical protein